MLKWKAKKLKVKIVLVFCALLLLLIPFVVAGAIASNPLGFLGELLFTTGNIADNENDIKEIMNGFTSIPSYPSLCAYIDSKKFENLTRDEVWIYYILSINEEDTKGISTDDDIFEALNTRKWIDDFYDSYSGKTTHEINKELRTSPGEKNKVLSNRLNEIADSRFDSIVASLSQSTNENTHGGSGVVYADIYSDSYTTLNPLHNAGYRGQCTWYAWGRSHEVAGVIMPTGNAITWYGATNLPKGSQPRKNAVAVFPIDGYGHVLFVEDYNAATGEISFSESNFNNPCIYGGMSCDAVVYARENTEKVMNKETMPYISLVMRYGNPVGFIYTD